MESLSQEVVVAFALHGRELLHPPFKGLKLKRLDNKKDGHTYIHQIHWNGTVKIYLTPLNSAYCERVVFDQIASLTSLGSWAKIRREINIHEPKWWGEEDAFLAFDVIPA